MDSLKALRSRNRSFILAAVLLLALAVRVAAFLSLKKTLYFDFRLWDEQVYHTIAGKIASGIFQSNAVYEFSPLPIYLMALVYKLFSPDIVYIRILHLALGVLTCLNIYKIGEHLTDYRVGLLSCLIAALYKPFIFYSVVPLKTAQTLFFFSLLVWLFVSSLNRINLWRILLLGVVAGCILNIRPNCLVFIPFLPLLVLWIHNRGLRFWKDGAKLTTLFFIGFLIAVAPFVVRNYRTAGVLALTTSQTGQNLVYGNNYISREPYYRPMPFALSTPFSQGIQFTIEASRRVGRRLSHSEASNYWTKEVLKQAWKDPAMIADRFWRKTLALFNRFEAGDHYHIGFISDFAKFFRFPFFSIWLVMPLAMAGIVLAVSGSRKAIALTIICALYASTLVLFFVSTRLRLPLLTVLIPFAAAGLVKIRSVIRERKTVKGGLYAVTAATVMMVGFIPLIGTDDMTAYYNTHAIIHDSMGSPSEAIKYWRLSSEMKKPYSSFADLSLASMLMEKGDYTGALEYLNRIPEGSFAVALKYAVLGDVLYRMGDLEKAVLSYEKSLQINSGQLAVRKKLISLYKITAPAKVEPELKKIRELSTYYNLM